MAKDNASAFPTKRFFLEMFTRDISFEDCILDLIDNSIDALVRTRDLDISAQILTDDNGKPPARSSLPRIDVRCSQKQVTIRDTCGGVSYNQAKNDIFTFGHKADLPRGQLGAYGIGMKRAIFKIGNRFEMESCTPESGFKAKLDDIGKWAQKDGAKRDWVIPLYRKPRASSLADARTVITISDINEDVKHVLANPHARDNSIYRAISRTYALFLNRFVRVTLNGKQVRPEDLPLGSSSDIEPARQQFDHGPVKVTLIGTLASRAAGRKWEADNAGWYVFCNGRITVRADKSDLTGWGTRDMPEFHSKYRGFLGIAYFSSTNPLSLPWTTTKRGVNRESPVYQEARKRMAELGRPVIRFLNEMYPSEPQAESHERSIAKKLGTTSFRSLADRETSEFQVKKKRRRRQTTVSIQYKAEMSDVKRVAKYFRKPNMAASEVGERTFKWFLDKEAPR